MVVLAGASVAIFIGITRNMYCNPEALRLVEPPYGGQLMPANFSLVERKYFFQFTKWVDVFAEDGTYVGYFYDINLFIIMRFGFSDPSHRIWFEARYASFLSRFKPIVEYNLQRCDVGPGGRPSPLFEIKEDWWNEIWICVVHCNRLFNISQRVSNVQQVERLLPPAGFGRGAVARAEFYSSLTATWRGSITGPPNDYAGAGLRHRWFLTLATRQGGPVVAEASQRFGLGSLAQNVNVISHWKAVTAMPGYLPNWVVGFMATLDDIDEDYND